MAAKKNSLKICRSIPMLAIVLGVACSNVLSADSPPDNATNTTVDGMITILPGDARFNTPAFEDYQAVYTSSSSKTGGFTLQARKSGDRKKLTLIDIIPMEKDVIVAHRNINLTTHRLESGAGPYFAWGPEFVVSQATSKRYEWTRVPIGGGAPNQTSGKIQNSGYVSEMFSPTIASLMPMEIGSTFRLPEAYPRKGEFVSSEFDEYEVLRKERLDLDSGFGCNCWVIEKKTWTGMKEQLWVSRDAPFVFRRHRDVGGNRDYISDLLHFEQLNQ